MMSRGTRRHTPLVDMLGTMILRIATKDYQQNTRRCISTIRLKGSGLRDLIYLFIAFIYCQNYQGLLLRCFISIIETGFLLHITQLGSQMKR